MVPVRTVWAVVLASGSSVATSSPMMFRPWEWERVGRMEARNKAETRRGAIMHLPGE
jgi:hypothetical protein